MNITRDDILAATSESINISGVARRLGLCERKLSGSAAKKLRLLVPEIDSLLNAKAGVATTTQMATKVTTTTNMTTTMTTTVASLPSQPTNATPPEGIAQHDSSGSSDSSGTLVLTATPTPTLISPYRPGSTYDTLFYEGSRKYQTKEELISRVAKITKKPARCIAFSLAVLCRKAHSSNQGRSMALQEDGKLKLIALKRKATPSF